MLFTSKAFKEGKSELVFFITPEIVDPRTNNQFENFATKTNFTKDMELNQNDKSKSVEKETTNISKTTENTSTSNSNTSQSEQEERLKEILGYK